MCRRIRATTGSLHQVAVAAHQPGLESSYRRAHPLTPGLEAVNTSQVNPIKTRSTNDCRHHTQIRPVDQPSVGPDRTVPGISNHQLDHDRTLRTGCDNG